MYISTHIKEYRKPSAVQECMTLAALFLLAIVVGTIMGVWQ